MATIEEALDAAVAHQSAGRLDEAARIHRLIIEAAPETARAWHYLAMVRGATGDMEGAAGGLRVALALEPALTASLRTLAAIDTHRGDRAATARAESALAWLSNDDPEAHGRAAVAALAAGDIDAGTRHTARAFRLDPDDLRRPALLCGALPARSEWRRMRTVLTAWLSSDPASVDAWELMGATGARLGDGGAGFEAFDRAARLSPGSAPILLNLGRTARQQRRPTSARAAMRAAVALDPADSIALYELAALSLNLGLPEDARALLDRSLTIRPGQADVELFDLVLGLYRDDRTPAERLDHLRRWHSRHTPAEVRDRPPSDHPNDPDPDRTLRIGYVSADMRGDRPVRRNMLPVLRAHDRGNFRVHVYADIPIVDDGARAVVDACDVWRDIHALDDASVAERIRGDGIDVLVHLAVHFDGNRLLLPAHGAAPVQIAHHDVESSGAPLMDHLVTDRIMTPRRGIERFAERTLRLPHFYLADPILPRPDVGPPPATIDGRVTFGCFNNPAKLSAETLALWGAVLRAVPDSRLALRFINIYEIPACRDRVIAHLGAAGVAPDRIAFLPRVPMRLDDHLAQYGAVDVALDPFPFSGSTTSFEALSVGVPVVTLAVDRMVGRWTASMLDALRRREWIAETPDAYVAIAARLAADTAALARERRILPGLMAASSLCDARMRTRQLERLYRAAWRRWVAHQSRQSRR